MKEQEYMKVYKKGLVCGFIRGMNTGLVILLFLWLIHLIK